MKLQWLDGPVIEAGESLSSGLDCTSGDIVRITMPSTKWSGGNMTFQISTDGQGYNDLYDARGNEVTLVMPKKPHAAVIVLNEEWVKAVGWIKFRAGTAASPVPQVERQQFGVTVEQYETSLPAGSAKR